jgi:hypothetical protein
VQFSVITADDAETSYEGTYQVLDNAVLVVHPDDKGQPTVRLSPAYWRQIIEPREEYDIWRACSSDRTPGANVQGTRGF